MSEKIQRYVAQCGGLWFGYEPWDGLDEGDDPVCLSADVDKLEVELLSMRCCGNCDHYHAGGHIGRDKCRKFDEARPYGNSYCGKGWKLKERVE